MPASATSSCTQLTEDDKIFIAISPVFPDCYQQTYDTPVIAGSLPGRLPASAAPDFTFIPPNAAFDPVQLAASTSVAPSRARRWRSSTARTPMLQRSRSCRPTSRSSGSTSSSPPRTARRRLTPSPPTKRLPSIAQRFQSAGVNVVVGVGGSGSTTWPRALLDNQSTYKPVFIASDEAALISYVESAKGNTYLDNV